MTYQSDPTQTNGHDRKPDLRQGAEFANHPGWRKFGVAMLGAGIGLGAGLLLAPTTGATVRGKMRNAASRTKSKLSLHGDKMKDQVEDLADDAASALGARGHASPARRPGSEDSSIRSDRGAASL